MAALLLATSCTKSASTSDEPNIGYGRLAIEFSADSAITMTTTRSDSDKYYLDAALIPSQEEFVLTIEGSYIDSESGETKQLSRSYENLEAYNTAESLDGETAPPTLPAGDYTFTLSDGGDTAEESAMNVCFSGSTSITLYAQDFDATACVTVSMQNAAIALETSEYFDGYFAGGATLKLSTEGGASISYDSYDYDEQTILFVAPLTTLYLEGTATKQAPTEDPESAPTVTFVKSEIGSTTAGTLSRVVVDAAEAGGGKISIILDDTITEIIYETIELNPIQ